MLTNIIQKVLGVSDFTYMQLAINAYTLKYL